MQVSARKPPLHCHAEAEHDAVPAVPQSTPHTVAQNVWSATSTEASHWTPPEQSTVGVHRVRHEAIALSPPASAIGPESPAMPPST